MTGVCAWQVSYIPTLMVQEGYREVLGRRVRLTEIERRLGDPTVIATFADFERLPGAAAAGAVNRIYPK